MFSDHFLQIICDVLDSTNTVDVRILFESFAVVVGVNGPNVRSFLLRLEEFALNPTCSISLLGSAVMVIRGICVTLAERGLLELEDLLRILRLVMPCTLSHSFRFCCF